MRQRNNTGQPLTVHTDPPQALEPGAEVDHDSYIVGLTVLDEPEPPAEKPAKPSSAKAAVAKEEQP